MFQIHVIILAILFNGNYCLDLRMFYKYVQSNENTSTTCEIQKTNFLTALHHREIWALTMLDASGRIPNAGNLIDLGLYDQCVGISTKINNTLNIRGKYCLNGLRVPLDVENFPSFYANGKQVQPKIKFSTNHTKNETNKTDIASVVFLAVCIPDACFPSDFFGEFGSNRWCERKNENKILSSADIVCLVFLGIVFLFIISSTVYDLYLKHCDREPKYVILLAFSVYSNVRNIMKTTQEPDQILFLNGLKVISMCWVILFHRYGFLATAIINVTDFHEWSRRWYTFYYWDAHLAVDTFFFITGILVTYNFLKIPQKELNILKFYFHRYLRLTPPLAVLFFVQLTLARRIASGPLYNISIESYNRNCRTNWWAFFFYIQNYAVPDKMCMVHTWYLSVDMQFFIISPILLLPIARYGNKVAYTVLPILTVFATVYLMPIFYAYDFTIYSEQYLQIYYGTTHSRFPPWLLGITFGAFITDYRKNKQRYAIKNRLLVLTIWIAVIALGTFVLIYQNDVDFNRTTLKGAVFYPLQKTLWALCLCWICYACLTKNAIFINWFLSLPIFQILSKVTYSTYLLHVLLLLMHLGFARTRFYFTDYEAFRVVIADTFIAYLVGTLWTLAFESPTAAIEKALLGSRKKIKSKTITCQAEETV